MTRGSIREYTEAVRECYLHGLKKEKGEILDEFTKVTGRHRKAAIRLLCRRNQPKANKKRGCPRQYSATVAGALVGYGEIPSHQQRKAKTNEASVRTIDRMA